MKPLAALVTLFALASPADAASPRVCRNTTASRINRIRVVSTTHNTNHHAAQQQFVVTAFAVPVAVPVAPFAPYWYSVSEYVGQAVPDIRPQERRQVGQAVPDIRAQERADTTSHDRSIITQRCTSCHGRTSPKQGVSLVDPLSLSDKDRLRAIRAVISGEMPPADAEPLTTTDRTAILQQLIAE